MNRHIRTVVIAPMRTAGREYPTRIRTSFEGKKGQIVLDLIRTVDKRRLVKVLGKIDDLTLIDYKSTEYSISHSQLNPFFGLIMSMLTLQFWI
jgi:mRNA-degrading endonuclease toxin of MazEF toxin-antitoxin module